MGRGIVLARTGQRGQIGEKDRNWPLEANGEAGARFTRTLRPADGHQVRGFCLRQSPSQNRKMSGCDVTSSPEDKFANVHR